MDRRAASATATSGCNNCSTPTGCPGSPGPAENLNFTNPPGLPHPIDNPRLRFLTEATCGKP